jgi:hypothetical protein
MTDDLSPEEREAQALYLRPLNPDPVGALAKTPPPPPEGPPSPDSHDETEKHYTRLDGEAHGKT